jgi:acyl-coenzyme A synthetase/AMP-(fatty) acid ligase
VKRVTAPYKHPREIEFVAELPKNASGKLLRRQLRDREYAAATGSGSTPRAAGG